MMFSERPESLPTKEEALRRAQAITEYNTMRENFVAQRQQVVPVTPQQYDAHLSCDGAAIIAADSEPGSNTRPKDRCGVQLIASQGFETFMLPFPRFVVPVVRTPTEHVVVPRSRGVRSLEVVDYDAIDASVASTSAVNAVAEVFMDEKVHSSSLSSNSEHDSSRESALLRNSFAIPRARQEDVRKLLREHLAETLKVPRGSTDAGRGVQSDDLTAEQCPAHWGVQNPLLQITSRATENGPVAAEEPRRWQSFSMRCMATVDAIEVGNPRGARQARQLISLVKQQELCIAHHPFISALRFVGYSLFNSPEDATEGESSSVAPKLFLTTVHAIDDAGRFPPSARLLHWGSASHPVVCDSIASPFCGTSAVKPMTISLCSAVAELHERGLVHGLITPLAVSFLAAAPSMGLHAPVWTLNCCHFKELRADRESFRSGAKSTRRLTDLIARGRTDTIYSSCALNTMMLMGRYSVFMPPEIALAVGKAHRAPNPHELLHGIEWTEAADLWALGVTLLAHMFGSDSAEVSAHTSWCVLDTNLPQFVAESYDGYEGYRSKVEKLRGHLNNGESAVFSFEEQIAHFLLLENPRERKSAAWILGKIAEKNASVKGRGVLNAPMIAFSRTIEQCTHDSVRRKELIRQLYRAEATSVAHAEALLKLHLSAASHMVQEMAETSRGPQLAAEVARFAAQLEKTDLECEGTLAGGLRPWLLGLSRAVERSRLLRDGILSGVLNDHSRLTTLRSFIVAFVREHVDLFVNKTQPIPRAPETQRGPGYRPRDQRTEQGPVATSQTTSPRRDGSSEPAALTCAILPPHLMSLILKDAETQAADLM